MSISKCMPVSTECALMAKSPGLQAWYGTTDLQVWTASETPLSTDGYSHPDIVGYKGTSAEAELMLIFVIHADTKKVSMFAVGIADVDGAYGKELINERRVRLVAGEPIGDPDNIAAVIYITLSQIDMAAHDSGSATGRMAIFRRVSDVPEANGQYLSVGYDVEDMQNGMKKYTLSDVAFTSGAPRTYGLIMPYERDGYIQALSEMATAAAGQASDALAISESNSRAIDSQSLGGFVAI